MAIALSVVAGIIELLLLITMREQPVLLIGAAFTIVGALLSRRVPWAGLLLTLAGTAVVLAAGRDPIVEYSVVVFTLFGVSVRGFPPIRGAAVAAGTLAAMFSVASIARGVDVLQTDALAAVVAAVAGGAIGTALRLQRQYWQTLELREQDAIARGEVEAERRAAEERLRIARDLHDIIGHNVAVISMHLGAVEVSAGRDQVVLERSLRASRAAVQSVLAETQQTLNLLRGSGDSDAGRLRPVPNLAGIAELLESFEEIGLQIDADLDIETAAQNVDPGVALVAYRLVQEALTNAHRYGNGEAAVSVSADTELVSIEVINPTPAAPRSSDGSGYGLLGARERAASVGGTVDFGDDQGVFRVIAKLPVTGRILP